MKSGITSALVIFVALGAITMSCEKEQLKPAKESKEHTTPENTKDGGDDDDDPVIRGKVKKSTGLAVYNASVETITYGTNVSVGTTYTDVLGDYSQKVPVGIYYLKVINPSSGIPVYTDTVHVNHDVTVNVTAD